MARGKEGGIIKLNCGKHRVPTGYDRSSCGRWLVEPRALPVRRDPCEWRADALIVEPLTTAQLLLVATAYPLENEKKA
jgi:hypothetical protein